MANKQNRKGRSKSGPRFVQIHHWVMATAAFRALSGNGKAAYLLVKARYAGTNNGRISVSAREMADFLGVTKSTGARAIAELVDRGFVVPMQHSTFNAKSRQATEYRLTECRCDVTGDLPTKEFARWSAVEKLKDGPTGGTHSPTGGTLELLRARNAA